jgi:YVTN family beta-propeller protein
VEKCDIGAAESSFTFAEGGGNPPVASYVPKGRLYVANYLDHTVSVINTMFNNVLATIPVCTFPREVVVNPSGTRAYVYCKYWPDPWVPDPTKDLGSISVVNTSTNTVIATIPLPAPVPYLDDDPPGRMTINPSGTRLFLAITGGPNSGVTVIDTITHAVNDWSKLSDPNAAGLAIDPFGYVLYVTDHATCEVFALNAWTGQTLATIPSAGNYGIVWHNPSNRLWAVKPGSTNCVSDGATTEIDPPTHSVVNTVELSGHLSRVASHPFLKRLYVPLDLQPNQKGALAIIDTESKKLLATVVAGRGEPTTPQTTNNVYFSQPRGVAIHPKGSRVYVANSADHTVTVLNTSNDSVVTTISVGKHPMGMAVRNAQVVLEIP